MLKLLKRIKENRLQHLTQQCQELFQEMNLECQVEYATESIYVFSESPDKKKAVSAYYTVKFILFKKRPKNLKWKIYPMKGFTQKEVNTYNLQFGIENQMWFPLGQCVISDDNHTYLSNINPKKVSTKELTQEIKNLQTI